MDKDILVREGQNLIRYLDQSKVKPRGVMWVHSSDLDTWRLWIVPSTELTDKSEFYRLVSEAISQHRDEMPGLDIGDIELKKPDHPAIVGLKGFLRMDGLGSAYFSNNRLNGYFLPDGVVLRMAL